MNDYFKVENLTEDYNSNFQNAILGYVLKNISPELFEKIKKQNKNISDAYLYVFNEIKEEYIKNNGRTSGGCYVEPEVVFGKVIHYFEEESIKKFEKVKPQKTVLKNNDNDDEDEIEEDVKPVKKQKPINKKKEENNNNEWNLFNV